MSDTVLIVEDEAEMRDYLQELCIDQGYTVHTADSGLQARKLFEKVVPDVILLDLNLPDIPGQTLCEEVKQTYPEVVVIMVTAKDTPQELAKGLNLGADDYIAKPFDPQELIARLAARTRPSGTVDQQQLHIADLVLDTKTHQVTRHDKPIDLTPQEFKLLEYLMSNPDMVLSREMILSRIWGTAADVETRVVDVYIGYLRKKIDRNFKPKLIQSVRGFGYMLKTPQK